MASGRDYIITCQSTVLYKQAVCTKSGHQPRNFRIYTFRKLGVVAVFLSLLRTRCELQKEWPSRCPTAGSAL